MYIIGAGAQAKYVIEIVGNKRLMPMKVYVKKILDPIGRKVGQTLYEIPIEKLDVEKISKNSIVAICTADNHLKHELYKKIKDKCLYFPEFVHKEANVAERVTVQGGCILNAGCVIQPDAFIGMFSMIHAGVIVDHDTMVGFYCNIAPGVTLCGHVKIGDYTTIGPGSTITKNITIGKNSVIGAGAVVLNDVPDNVVAYGNPCKIIRENK